MRKIFTLLLAAVVGSFAAQAQQQSRVVRVSNMRDNGQGMVLVDSSHVIYKDNSRGIDGTEYQYVQYLEGKTSCDTVVMFVNYQGSLITGARYQMTYDANGRITMHHLLRPTSATSPLVSYQRVSFTYDASGNITKELREEWNATTNTWGNYSQKLKEYTGGNMTKEQRQMWHNGAWANDQLAEYTYNNGLKIDYFFTSWNYMTGAQYNKSKSIYSYNSSGHFIQVRTQEYDNNTSTYIDKSREVHTVDANGNILLTLSQNWNRTTSLWEDASKLSFLFNSKNQNTLDTFEQWDAVNNKWKPSLTYEYTYDDSGNNTAFILQLWNTDSARYIRDQRISQDWNLFNQLTRYHTYRWNKTTMIWEQVPGEYNNRYYYELYTPAPGAVAAQQMEAGMKLYPIPARDVVTVKLSAAMKEDFTVSITDISGRVVNQWKEKATANYSRQVPLHDVQPGNYFITINDGEQAAAKMFTVLR